MRIFNSRVLLTAALFGAGILTRLPFRSYVLYHWDSVNFALALEHFDVQIDQPQPPGYVLYILLGRLFNWFLQDPNASLVWISILFSALTVAAIFWLGEAMFGRRVGLVSAGLALTSPLFWFHGEVALSYITEAFFVTAVAFCGYRLISGEVRYFLPLSILLGVAGGFRQNTLVLLFPLWLFSLLYLSWRQRLLAAVTLGLVIASWLATMFYLNGGVDNYWAGLSSQSQGNLTISVAGSAMMLMTNWLRLTIYSFYALTLGLPLLVIGLVWSSRRWRDGIRKPEWQVLLVWLLPSLAFYSFFVQQAGYTFTFMPGVVLILGYLLVEAVARGSGRINLKPDWAGALVLMVLLANVAFFLLAPPFLLGQQRQLFNTPSWSAIHTRNVSVGEKVSYIRSNFPPEDTAILASQFDFRLPSYYLSDYQWPTLSQDAADTPVTIEDEIVQLVLFNDNIPVDYQSQFRIEEIQLVHGENLRWLKRDQRQVFNISAEGVAVIDTGVD